MRATATSCVNSPTLDHVGTLTRTVEQTAELLGALAGRDFAVAPVDGIRIGVLRRQVDDAESGLIHARKLFEPVGSRRGCHVCTTEKPRALFHPLPVDVHDAEPVALGVFERADEVQAAISEVLAGTDVLSVACEARDDNGWAHTRVIGGHDCDL